MPFVALLCGINSKEENIPPVESNIDIFKIYQRAREKTSAGEQ